MKIMTRLFLSLLTVIAFSSMSFAEGDAAKGEKVFKKCKACHQVGEGAKNKVGPQLNNLFGRTAGSVEGFKYSKKMKAAGETGIGDSGEKLVWTDETLSAFLKKPRKYIKGTKMSFAGLKKEKDLVNIVSYLKTFDTDE